MGPCGAVFTKVEDLDAAECESAGTNLFVSLAGGAHTLANMALNSPKSNELLPSVSNSFNTAICKNKTHVHTCATFFFLR